VKARCSAISLMREEGCLARPSMCPCPVSSVESRPGPAQDHAGQARSRGPPFTGRESTSILGAGSVGWSWSEPWTAVDNVRYHWRNLEASRGLQDGAATQQWWRNRYWRLFHGSSRSTRLVSSMTGAEEAEEHRKRSTQHVFECTPRPTNELVASRVLASKVVFQIRE
jgi:hypothetical protein